MKETEEKRYANLETRFNGKVLEMGDLIREYNGKSELLKEFKDQKQEIQYNRSIKNLEDIEKRSKTFILTNNEIKAMVYQSAISTEKYIENECIIRRIKDISLCLGNECYLILCNGCSKKNSEVFCRNCNTYTCEKCFDDNHANELNHRKLGLCMRKEENIEETVDKTRNLNDLSEF